MFYEPQYFKIEHRHPSALLGYILPLEARSAVSRGPSIFSKVTEAHGKKAGRKFVKLHAEEDPDRYVEKAFASIASLPIELHPLIIENLEQSTDAYLGMLAEIRVERARRRRRCAAGIGADERRKEDHRRGRGGAARGARGGSISARKSASPSHEICRRSSATWISSPVARSRRGAADDARRARAGVPPGEDALIVDCFTNEVGAPRGAEDVGGRLRGPVVRGPRTG